MNIKFLRITYICELLTSALLAVIFETGLLEGGQLADNPQTAYVLEIIGIVLALVCIPLAMKLFHFEKVSQAVNTDDLAFTRWSTYRLCLLGLPLLYNTLMYYLLGFDVTCGYLALMSVVPFIFIWPRE